MITLFGAQGYQPEPQIMPEGLPDCAACGCESDLHFVTGKCFMAWDRWEKGQGYWVDCTCTGYRAAQPVGTAKPESEKEGEL